MLKDKEKLFKYSFNSTPFEKKFAKEYMEFEKDNTKKLCDLKVEKELSFKKIKTISFFFNIFMAALLFYSYKNNANIIFMAFCMFVLFSNFSYIRYRKKHITDVEKVWTLSGFENIVKNEFLESYASAELLQEFQKEVGNQKYRDFIFENGSDDQKIKIKLLIL